MSAGKCCRDGTARWRHENGRTWVAFDKVAACHHRLPGESGMGGKIVADLRLCVKSLGIFILWILEQDVNIETGVADHGASYELPK